MSERNTSETSFHVLMQNLDESAAQDDIERILLDEIKESYRICNEWQEKLSVVNDEIRITKGDRLPYLRDKACRMNKRIWTEQNVIDALRGDPCLNALYEREKAKLLKQRESEKLDLLLSQLNLPPLSKLDSKDKEAMEILRKLCGF